MISHQTGSTAGAPHGSSFESGPISWSGKPKCLAEPVEATSHVGRLQIAKADKVKIAQFLSLLLMMTLTGMDLLAQDAPIFESRIDPIQAGDRLPDIELTDTKYHSVKVNDYLKETPLLLIYYRGGW